MPRLETTEDLKKYIYGTEDNLYKVRYTPWGRLIWRSVTLSKSGTYVFTSHSWWQTLVGGDLAVYENKIYCKANKRVKVPNPIFAKIKLMRERFEKRTQHASAI